MNAQTQNVPTDAEILAATPITNWRDAADALILGWTQAGRCYSSGEVARAIRIERPDLSFSVPSLGGRIREAFYANTLPMYPDDGLGNGPVTPLQRSRFTVGKYRTPQGVEVFVYGPNSDACDQHEFEVWIPSWDSNLGRMLTDADCPTPTTVAPSIQSAPGTPQHQAAQDAFQANVAAVIAGARPGISEFRATVWVDLRLGIGRGAFEALCHLSGTAIRRTDPVWVQVTGGKITVTLSDPGAAKPYQLVNGKGTVAFSTGLPLVPGSTFPIQVTKDGLVIDTTQV